MSGIIQVTIHGLGPLIAKLQKKLQITLEHAEEYRKVFGKQLV